MGLSHQQLMLLEQLTYLNDSVYKGAETSKVDNPRTIEELMSAFMDENGNLDLSSLDKPKTNADKIITGEQWAAIIREITSDEELMRLEIGDSYSNEDGDTLATCYVDPNSEEAYVTFAGTSGSREWHDNVLGLYESDTPCQEEALEFIESLPYDNITVTGHSKGGNKAMYVAILSDKVKECVSLDGQGFSKEFMEKYWAEIQKKGGIITNYSLDDDYVHILLSPIPNSKQIYCHGYNEDGISNHYPAAFFEIVEDENGNSHIRIHDNGLIVTPVTDENPGIAYLHDFTTFVINTMPYEDRKYMAEYLGVILAILMTGEYETPEGIIYTKDDLEKIILSDERALAILLAYVIKYVETYDLTMEELRGLLEGFGLGKLADSIEIILKALEFSPYNIDGEEAFNWLISQIGRNLRDGETDKFLLWLLEKFAGPYAEKYGIDIYFMWSKIEEEYTNIGKVDSDTANNNVSSKQGCVRDFSVANYQILMDAISKFSNSKIDDVSWWNSYKSESWFSKLNISIAIRLINAYTSDIIEVNEDCKRRIVTVFENMDKADKKNANAMRLHTTYLREEQSQLFNILLRINPYHV